MSIKISELTSAAKPLSGVELVVMNQNGSTVTTLLSDVKEYVFGGGGGDFAVTNATNVFTEGQTVLGVLSATSL